jgi:hypothetical protein
MRKFLCFLLLCFSNFSFAQFELEHTYNDNIITRVKLEIDGEKYYLVNTATSQADFYNADHSFWKSIPLPAPPQNVGFEVKINYVSQTQINVDNNIELIYSYFDTGLSNTFITKVISENGSVLLTIDNAKDILLSELDGLPTKLIPYQANTKIYSFPSLILENAYDQNFVTRIKLPNAGEKYFALDKVNNQALIYNSNHTLWKTIELPKPQNSYYTDISLVADSEIENDDLIKVGYCYTEWTGTETIYSGCIINENGQNLLLSQNTTSFFLSKIDGLSNKIIRTNKIPNTNNLFTSSVFNANDLSFENLYESTITRTILENSGEKYYTSKYPLNQEVKIYNSDHSLWKTIATPVPNENFKIVWIKNLSENKINSDNLIELSYTFYHNIENVGSFYDSKVVTENGNILLTIQGSNDIFVSELPELPNKLISFFGGMQVTIGSSKVYSLGALNITNFTKTNISIAPNPAKNEFEILSKNAIVEVTIFDAIGKLVLTKKAPNVTKIEVQNLSNGIYFVKMKADNNNQINQKIIISN